MAERSFKEEVRETLARRRRGVPGEGILAVTKALLQAGVSYVAGYQGAPISHLMDVLADANDILEDLGVHFESSASEATAAATLAASVNYPLRGAVTFKSTVGTNVASDALANLASGGVTGGAHDHRRRGLRRGLLDHAGAQPRLRDEVADLAARSASRTCPAIVNTVEKGFELSEASNTPVMLRGAHPRLPRPRPLQDQGQRAPDLHAERRAGEPAPRHEPHRAAAGELSCTRRRRSRSAGPRR